MLRIWRKEQGSLSWTWSMVSAHASKTYYKPKPCSHQSLTFSLSLCFLTQTRLDLVAAATKTAQAYCKRYDVGARHGCRWSHLLRSSCGWWFGNTEWCKFCLYLYQHTLPWKRTVCIRPSLSLLHPHRTLVLCWHWHRTYWTKQNISKMIHEMNPSKCLLSSLLQWFPYNLWRVM